MRGHLRTRGVEIFFFFFFFWYRELIRIDLIGAVTMENEIFKD